MAMTNAEKVNAVKIDIAPDTATDALLERLVKRAESIVLNKRYPFGVPNGATVPVQYEEIQISIAVELFSKRGAEGQTAHKENGIDRTWESADISPSLLNKIAPLCGSVK